MYNFEKLSELAEHCGKNSLSKIAVDSYLADIISVEFDYLEKSTRKVFDLQTSLVDSRKVNIKSTTLIEPKAFLRIQLNEAAILACIFGVYCWPLECRDECENIDKKQPDENNDQEYPISREPVFLLYTSLMIVSSSLCAEGVDLTLI